MKKRDNLGGAISIIDSGTERVEEFSNRKILNKESNKPGYYRFPQTEENEKQAILIYRKIKEFEKFWENIFLNQTEVGGKKQSQKLKPNKNLVKKVFIKMQELEDSLNNMLIKYPEAFQAWFDFGLFEPNLKKKAMETRVLEREKIYTMWERAIAQLDGEKHSEVEDRSFVLAGLTRIQQFRKISRINMNHFNKNFTYEQNYEAFVDFIKTNEKNW